MVEIALGSTRKIQTVLIAKNIKMLRVFSNIYADCPVKVI